MVDVSLRQLELFSALPNFTTLSAAATHLHILGVCAVSGRDRH